MRRHLSLLSIPVLAVTLAACGDSGTVSTQKTSSSTQAASTPATTTSAGGATNSAGCKQVSNPGPKSTHVKKPKGTLAKGKTYEVVLTTSCGAITIKLDTKHDPKTSASFASLVKAHFYDGLSFHRVVPGFVIQGGDPRGDGTGGPGYSVVEAPPARQQYVKGVVAMAKTGAEAPGTSGSQFFIVTGPDAGLPPEYAVAGTVVAGMDVAEKIGNIPPQGGQDGPPSEPVVIEKAVLKTR